jgi:hypothetical protein
VTLIALAGALHLAVAADLVFTTVLAFLAAIYGAAALGGLR